MAEALGTRPHFLVNSGRGVGKVAVFTLAIFRIGEGA
jgi:hypothetical protein